jgi:hypothetical protein
MRLSRWGLSSRSQFHQVGQLRRGSEASPRKATRERRAQP